MEKDGKLFEYIFDEVRRLLAALRDWPGMSRLQPVIHYWVKT